MNYLKRFGLERDPFGTTPDPAMFYRTLGHEDCYERLKLAILMQRGLSVIIGDIGYGKTTIKVALLQELQELSQFEIGIVNNPRECRTNVQFLRAILEQFGLRPTARTSMDLSTEFQRYLEQLAQIGRHPLLIIDEAQNLSSEHLETLRTFLSFETPTRKLISIALFAQPELKEKIERKQNLAQRVAMDHNLNPLNRNDTAAMIAHRLKVAGRPNGAQGLFTPAAIDVIYDRGQGIPRAITNFCADCLIEAASRGEREISGSLALETIGRRVFTGTDWDLRDGPIEPSNDAGSVISMAAARERRRGA